MALMPVAGMSTAWSPRSWPRRAGRGARPGEPGRPRSSPPRTAPIHRREERDGRGTSDAGGADGAGARSGEAARFSSTWRRRRSGTAASSAPCCSARSAARRTAFRQGGFRGRDLPAAASRSISTSRPSSDAYRAGARAAHAAGGGATACGTPPVPERARTAALQPLLERLRRLPQAVQPLALEGVRRTIDYQDPDYAALYLARLERIAALDAPRRALDGRHVTQETARALALWMTFEDTIRVADLKTRSARFARVHRGSPRGPGQLFGITDFMKPRVAEIAGTLPAGIGAWVLALAARVALARPLHRRQADPHQHGVRLPAAARRRRACGACGAARCGSAEENGRIEAWLDAIERLRAAHYDLAVELARAQRLIKGYGETHERGWRNFCAARRAARAPRRARRWRRGCLRGWPRPRWRTRRARAAREIAGSTSRRRTPPAG